MKKKIIRLLKTIIKKSHSVIPKNSKKIIFKSVPDYTGNCKALSDFIMRNHPDFEVVWVCDSNFKLNSFKGNNLKFVKTKSISWLIEFITSRYIATTHNEMVGIASYNQVYISLWHGMPLKKICYLAPNDVDFMEDYSAKRIATSEIMKAIIAAAFHEKAPNVEITGQPRNDFLFDKVDLSKANINIHSGEKVIFYAPTFRYNNFSQEYSDGKKISGDNIFRFPDFNMISFNEFLKRENIRLLVKLHPFEEKSLKSESVFSNINIVKSEQLIASGYDINHILAQTDCLLTDYSSVYFDYLIINKPLGFIVPDFESYRGSRGGFTLEPAETWMPGPKISKQVELIDYLMDIFCRRIDAHSSERTRINDMLNNYKDNCNSKRVFDTFIR